MRGNEDVLIEGSVEAIRKLREAGVTFRFCTNTSTRSAEDMAVRLQGLGFDARPEELFTPIPLTLRYLKENNLRPFLIVDPGVQRVFDEINKSDPNCVILGDAQDQYSYAHMNQAFQILMKNQDSKLVTLGAGSYYKEVDGLKLDCGTFSAALEFASGIKAKVIGKPDQDFFLVPLEDMKIKPDKAIMVGDDLILDIQGGQSCGIRSVLVRTGKYRPQDENHPSIKPDGCVDNLLSLVNLYLKHKT